MRSSFIMLSYLFIYLLFVILFKFLITNDWADAFYYITFPAGVIFFIMVLFLIMFDYYEGEPKC